VLPVVTGKARQLLQEAPQVSHDMAGLGGLFQWYLGCQWGRCMQVLAGVEALTEPGEVYWDQTVSVFRHPSALQGVSLPPGGV